MAKRWAPRRARLFKMLAVLFGLVLAGLVGEIGLRLARARYRVVRERGVWNDEGPWRS